MSEPRLPPMLYWVRFLNDLNFAETRWFSSLIDAKEFKAKHAGSTEGYRRMEESQR